MLGVALQVSGLVQRVHQDEDGREAAGSGHLPQRAPDDQVQGLLHRDAPG